jgi:hypothetical protein
MSRDILQLKLQKRLIEEQLKLTDDRMHRLDDIVLKKNASRTHIRESAAERTVTSLGLTVSEFQMPRRDIKAVPKVHVYDPYATEAVPVTNPNILRIRQQHELNTTGQQEVKRRIKQRDIEEARKIKHERGKPNIKVPPSMLPNRYVRGELPCTIEHGSGSKYLSWACPLENLDYEFYLPLFFDGLQCDDKIISFIARQGIEDMLYASRGHPERIKSVIPLLVRPLRNALSKFDIGLLLAVLKALEQLITCNDGIGEVLLPFGKQFLAPIAFFMDLNKNMGDTMDFGQRRHDDIGEEVREYFVLLLTLVYKANTMGMCMCVCFLFFIWLAGIY